MRRIVLSLLGLALTVGMIGCGEKKPEPTTTPPAAGSGDAAPATPPADKPAEN